MRKTEKLIVKWHFWIIKTYEMLARLYKDELEELRKGWEVGASLAKKEAQTNRLTKENATLSYGLV